MSVRSIALAAAACVAATLSTVVPTPAVAADIVGADIVVAPERITVRVSYADLNLANAQGRAVLDRRIAAAARNICGSFFPADLETAALVRDCREDAVASVRLPAAYASNDGLRAVMVSGNRMSRAAN